MPNFPTYYGPPLPKALSLLNPAHYWLVFKWVFFQPNRLKHYLYQIDPELYRATGLRSLLQTLRLSAYRNLYLIALIASFLAAVGVAYIASAAQATPIDWGRLISNWVFSVALGVALGMALGVALGVALSVTDGVARSAAVGVVFSVALGVAVSVAVSVAFSVALGVAVSVAGSVAFSVAVSVVGSVVLGVAGDMVLGVAVAGSVVLSVALVIGASRLLFYPFELLGIALSKLQNRERSHRLKYHPAFWDELAVWPLPGFGPWLRQQLDNDFEDALRTAVTVAANPFQRWAVQRALSDWLTSQSDRLAALQRLIHWPPLAEYLTPPVAPRHFSDLPDARVVLFGELGQRFVDGTGRRSGTSERIVWLLTRRLRRIEPTP